MMASAAKYRDDIAGAIVTTGASTSYQVFDTLVHLAGQMIAFTPHVTNAATVTLNVYSLGDKLHGTPYAAVYNNRDGAVFICAVSSGFHTTCRLARGWIFGGRPRRIVRLFFQSDRLSRELLTRHFFLWLARHMGTGTD
jgi:hypothetical protein